MPDIQTVFAAAVFIVDDDERVLLIKENYGRRRWGLPGGATEDGETAADTARREAREETGVEVELEHELGLYTIVSRDRELHATVFWATIEHGAPTIPDTGEIADVRWVDVRELPTPTTNTLAAAVEDFLAGRSGVNRRIQNKFRP